MGLGKGTGRTRKTGAGSGGGRPPDGSRLGGLGGEGPVLGLGTAAGKEFSSEGSSHPCWSPSSSFPPSFTSWQ